MASGSDWAIDLNAKKNGSAKSRRERYEEYAKLMWEIEQKYGDGDLPF